MVNIKKCTNFFSLEEVNIYTKKHPIKVRIADGFFSRLRGLLWSKPINKTEGLLLRPCNSIHTAGMAYPIDVVFLSATFQVLRVVPNCNPWRIANEKEAQQTLELLAGQAAVFDLKPGMQLTMEQIK